MNCKCKLFSTALFVAHTKTLEKMDGILTKERFRLFSQKCVLRNTAGLLDFILHRVLFISSVKIVYCHIAISHTLRTELICGSFQFYIWCLFL